MRRISASGLRLIGARVIQQAGETVVDSELGGHEHGPGRCADQEQVGGQTFAPEGRRGLAGPVRGNAPDGAQADAPVQGREYEQVWEEQEAVVGPPEFEVRGGRVLSPG